MGVTFEQEQALRQLLLAYRGGILHHGDALGADAQAHDIAVELGLAVVIHPPDIDAQRAWKVSPDVREPRPYLDRNKDIVNESEMLIAGTPPAKAALRS